MTFQERVYRLLEEQRRNWGLLRTNHDGLSNVKTKSFDFGHYNIHLQYNPKRIISSGAKVDNASIMERLCFLCSENRPSEQDSVMFENTYEILCNPFPIFSEHLTIASLKHTSQKIDGELINMLHLSRELPGMAVFYNGPKCGASAPDHMHFQAGNRGLMPIEKDFDLLIRKYGKLLCQYDDAEVISVNDGLRKYIVIESSGESSIEKLFSIIYNKAKDFSSEEEPMMNILAYYKKGWRIFIFLRERHRPDQYFKEGEENILFSPASVDMGGTLIIPLEKDFKKIVEADIRDMFQQVSLADEKFNEVSLFLKQSCPEKL